MNMLIINWYLLLILNNFTHKLIIKLPSFCHLFSPISITPQSTLSWTLNPWNLSSIPSPIKSFNTSHLGGRVSSSANQWVGRCVDVWRANGTGTTGSRGSWKWKAATHRWRDAWWRHWWHHDGRGSDGRLEG